MELKTFIQRGLIFSVVASVIVGYLVKSWLFGAAFFSVLFTAGFEIVMIWLFIRMSNDMQRVREWIEWYFTKDDPVEEPAEED